MEDAARNCVTYARQLATNGCYSKAFDLYITAFEKSPHMKSMFEPELRAVLIRFNEVLATSGKIEDIFNNFGRAINQFPNNIYLLNDIGKYLYKFSFYPEAWSHFEKALKIDSGFVEAEKNLNSVKNLLVERWHFRMLNDNIRNRAYHDAIIKTMVPYKETVLDLGTGTGILSLYAYESKPISITAVDGSEVMVNLAESITQENNAQNIIIFNKMSTDLDYTDIAGKKSLLITELFDAGLFGEHILQSLSHAWDNLITSDGRVLPNRAEFFVVGAKCDFLNLKYQLSTFAKKYLNVPTICNIHALSYGESYDCEDVHKLGADITYLTEPQSLVKVNFNDPNELKQMLQRTVPYDVEFKCLDDGEINLIVGWFDLHLTKSIKITTNPLSSKRANAWQQAIFYDVIPHAVRKDETVTAQFKLNSGKLTLLQEPKINRISSDIIRFLNDKQYVQKITGCIGMASVYLGQIAEMSEINIVDLCPYPLFGMLMLKRGAQSVVCTAKTEEDKLFILMAMEMNDIHPSRLIFLEGDDWSQDAFKDEKFHAVFCHLFEQCGELDMRYGEIAQQLKRAHLITGGLFLPYNVTIMAQVVSSHWLDINNRIYDENINYKMAVFMNKYQSSQNFCIDFTHLEYSPISSPTVIGRTRDGLRSEVINVAIEYDGDASAILCWYEIQLLEGLDEITTNRPNAFMDGMVFLASPQVPMHRGEIANILRCVDPDGSFKLVIDVEAT